MLIKYTLIFGFLALFASLSKKIFSEKAEPLTITIHAVPGMQYDLPRFRVSPGSSVTLVLSNQDNMLHNLLITQPGAREKVVAAALQLGEKGPAQHYIPSSPDVLLAVPVLSPGQSHTLTFTAPEEKGVYPYVCTYPGHGAIMYGAMYVTEEPLPAIKNDHHIPASRRMDSSRVAGGSHEKHHQRPKVWHPYTPEPPYLYRVFIPGASPAAIAVCLTQDLSYCWDAGSCRLRFAWKGGFVDNADLWKGKGDVSAHVIGEVFFRDQTDYPFRLSMAKEIPEVAFRGYSLQDGYFQFHYTLNGLDIYEMLLPEKGGRCLRRNFSIPAISQPLFFISSGQDSVLFESTAGSWQGDTLQLSPAEAREFSIIMAIKEKEKL